MSTSVGSTKLPFSWRGHFNLSNDSQSIDPYLSSRDLEIEIEGEWYPIDWHRLRRSHPELAAKIAAEVRAEFRKR